MSTKVKLNLGSNNKIIGDDWINVDGLDLPNVDLTCDLNITPFNFINKKLKFEQIIKIIDPSSAPDFYDKFKINNDTIDEISMCEVLEHISFRNTEKVLEECYRILKPNSKLHIQVPDCGKMMKYYMKEEICDCVNHKETKDGFNAKYDCIDCYGLAKINTKRWLYSFTGAQKHKYDAHLMIFTKDILNDLLVKVGFSKIRFKEHIYKLKVNIYK